MKKITFFGFLVALLSVLSMSGCSRFDQQQTSMQNKNEVAELAFYNCAGCHGTQNQKVWMMSPNLLGQKKGYLIAQMKDFRDGKRSHPFMDGVVEGLSDQQITALATYYSEYRAK